MNELRFAILSCSLNPESRTFLLAQEARRRLSAAGHSVALFDLRQHPIPPFDDSQVYSDTNLRAVNGLIGAADGVILAVPVYNWAIESAAKNLIEATGSNDRSRNLVSPWFDQLVTFLVCGGLQHSYTAHTGIASSLMLDFKCVVNPYHVYLSSHDWADGAPTDRACERLDRALDVKIDLARRLRGRNRNAQWSV